MYKLGRLDFFLEFCKLHEDKENDFPATWEYRCGVVAHVECIEGSHRVTRALLPLQGNRARCSENWLVERVNASGLGLTIGSVGASTQGTCVRNITFRNSVMHNTFKGVYVKSRPTSPGNTATIEDIVYENITMYNPEQWAVWIGPAQQDDTEGECSRKWADVCARSVSLPSAGTSAPRAWSHVYA